MGKVEKMPSDAATRARLATPNDLDAKDAARVAEALNACLADAFVLYLKTKNFHWHVSGPNFRDYHLMFDEQAEAIFATVDQLAERVRKIGRPTLHSFAEALKLTQLSENEAANVAPQDMIDELIADNKAMAKAMRAAHKVCDEADDVASASLLENFIDETERRTWFLFETSRKAGPSGQ